MNDKEFEARCAETVDLKECRDALHRLIFQKGMLRIPAQPDDDDFLIDRALDELQRMRAQNKRYREALKRQIDFWFQLPAGVDEGADAGNLSPSDMEAHIAGLAVRDAEKALDDETQSGRERGK